jgi:hypothetical protein
MHTTTISRRRFFIDRAERPLRGETPGENRTAKRLQPSKFPARAALSSGLTGLARFMQTSPASATTRPTRWAARKVARGIEERIDDVPHPMM